MQEDFDNYGEDFSLFLLEEVEKKRTDEPLLAGNYSAGTICECKWMEKYDSINPKYGYNSQDKKAKSAIAKMKVAKTTDVPFVEGLPQRKVTEPIIRNEKDEVIALVNRINDKKWLNWMRGFLDEFIKYHKLG